MLLGTCVVSRFHRFLLDGHPHSLVHVLLAPQTPITPPPARLSEFEVHVHYFNGYNQYQLFDYPTQARPGDAANAGQYSFEYKNIPDAWATLTKRLKVQYQPCS